MPTIYRFAADVVVVLHFAFVGFVLLGLLLTLLGGWQGWRWVRNVWFRATHLVAIAFVVAESLCGITCPLTVWEKELRDLAGEATYRGDFIAAWVHELLFYDAERWVFTTCYTLFGGLVLVSWWLVPPGRKKTLAPPDAAAKSS